MCSSRIGFDAFGIHSENHAISVNAHPGELIPRNISRFREQLTRVGLMFNWDHELSTTDPAYYKWTQWIFLQLFKAGLAVKKQGAVNWCPECKTVIANEQVNAGFCERHPDTKVFQKMLEQWFFAITGYAERLLENLPNLAWSDSTRAMQTNWIGQSEGAELVFRTPSDAEIRVFTTRPDTIFGATYMVLSPEHQLVEQLTTQEQRKDVNVYCREAAAKDIVSRKVGEREKTGVFTGSYARNPATGESIPIWVADYVLMEYGTGAIMAVPAHDQRDYEFATKFELEIRTVIEAETGADGALFTGWDGVLINSGKFDGMSCRDAALAITEWLGEQHAGQMRVQYRLHDWCISRQRYWGPPIPIIYCDACGTVPVPEKDLPVLLPIVEDFRPDESGVSPLARHEEWYEVDCPSCGVKARRETDVSDTFLDSAWYFLRYPSTEYDDRPFDKALTQKWLPVRSYIGGNEHAVLHLLYSRFITMVLHDLGHLDFEEPYDRFRAHGMIIKDGAKMSKSRGNVVIPDHFIAQWGADTFRMYLMFLGPYQEGGDFRDEGVSGLRRFLDRVWDVVANAGDGDRDDAVAQRKLHQVIRGVAEDAEALRYNTAIAKMMEYVNVLRGQRAKDDTVSISKAEIKPLIILLAPFAPHFAEECWEHLGHTESVFDASWPDHDEALASEETVEIVVQVNGKVRGRITVGVGVAESDAIGSARQEESVQRFLEGKELRNTIYRENKLVNFVVD